MALTINIDPVVINGNENIKNLINDLEQFVDYENYKEDNFNKKTFEDFFERFADVMDCVFYADKITDDKIIIKSNDPNWSCDTVDRVLEIFSKYTDNHYVEFRDEEGNLYRVYYLRDDSFKTIEPTLCWSMPGIYHNKED